MNADFCWQSNLCSSKTCMHTHPYNCQNTSIFPFLFCLRFFLNEYLNPQKGLSLDNKSLVPSKHHYSMQNSRWP